jgi:hypothetical protein
MTRTKDEEKRTPTPPPPPPPPPPMRRPNIEERISMLQMAMLHHQGRYQPSPLSSPGAIALVLPPLPTTHTVASSSTHQPSTSSPFLSNPSAALQQNPHHHPKDGMFRRLTSSLGRSGDKKPKKTKHGYHTSPVEEIYVRRLDESEW